ncbi:MAG: component of SufBCD complex [Alkalilacustris sp.]
MDWQSSLLGLIDTRSFSNIWFWIALAAMWTALSHTVLGVPFDMVARARREGGQAMADLEATVAAHVNRRLHMMATSGHWMAALTAFGLTVLGMLGFVYGLQLGQAVFLLALPATAVGGLGLRAARRLARDPLEGEALCSYLARHRLVIQLLGVVSILFTTFWAAVQVLTMSVLGG